MKLKLLIFCMTSIACFLQAQWMQWEARSNNSLEEFGNYITEMKDRGYAPVNISFVTHYNDPRVSSIWKKADIRDWACWHSMNQEAFIDKIKNFNQQGLSPVDIAVWQENGGKTRFAAIWQRSQYQGIIEIGIKANELNRKIVEYDKKGYSPKDLNGYTVNGEIFYTCIFDQQPKGTLNIVYGNTEDEFQRNLERLNSEGYFPIDVNYFNDNGIIRCNGIMAKATEAWDSRRGYSMDEFQNYLDTKTNEGFIPIDVDQYYLNGQFLFGATLTKPVKKNPVSSPQYQRSSYTPSFNNERTQLEIPPVQQQTKVWCWLATGEMIFRHYNLPNRNQVGNYQCGIIGSILQNTVCGSNCFNSQCIIPSGSNANTVKMLKEYSWLSSKKIFTCTEAYELSFTTIKNNLNNNKPILCGISPNRKQYYSGAEHAVLLVGYRIIDQVPYVIINDPFPYPYYDNPYIKYGAETLQTNQYLISLQSFTTDLFWHWSLSDIRII